MAEYKIGQIGVTTQDLTLTRAVSGEKVTVPKGTAIIIGADSRAHHLETGLTQPVGDATVKGYDTNGLAEYLCFALRSQLPLSEMLENFHIDEREFQTTITDALAEIGM